MILLVNPVKKNILRTIKKELVDTIVNFLMVVKFLMIKQSFV